MKSHTDEYLDLLIEARRIAECTDTPNEALDLITRLFDVVVTLRAERDYLAFFHAAANFGPSDTDVRYQINQEWLASGRTLPAGYTEESE